MATYKLNAVQSAMVNTSKASENQHGTSQFSFSLEYGNSRLGISICLFSFEDLPVYLRKKHIDSLEVSLYVSLTTAATILFLTATYLSKPFSQQDATYLSVQPLDIYDTSAGFGRQYYSQESFTGEAHLTDLSTSFGNFTKGLTNGLGVHFQIQTAAAGYAGHTDCTVYTHLSSHPPYLTFVYSDYKIKILNGKASPTSGFIDKKKANTFRWDFENRPEKIQTIDPVEQASAKFRWRPFGSSTYTEIVIAGSKKEITIPADTFAADNIQWQVVVTSDDGVEGEPSDWFTLTTVDSKSSAKPLSPVNVMVDGSLPVEFKWQHIINTGSPQSKYDLEYSADGGLIWEMLQSEETSDTFALILENTLPAGNLLWRVRTYNADGVPGEYSESAGFVVRAAPLAPVISNITAAARPVVRWQSVGQQAYEVAVTDPNDETVYSTGETAGTEKEQKVMEYLAAGTYTVGVRVWNVYGIASPWSYVQVTVPALEMAAPVLTARKGKGFVRLSWNGSGYAYYYLLRDGRPIAKLTDETEYLDYSALGTQTYLLRGITEDDAFRDSDPVKITLTVSNGLLAPADDLGHWAELVYRRGSEPTRGENLTISGQAVFAAGRQLPFYETNGQISRDWTFTYSVRTLEEYETLTALVKRGGTVLYRGKDGIRRWMVLTGIQAAADHLAWDYTLTAVEVDCTETIDYD